MSWSLETLGKISKCIQTGPFGSQLHQSDYSMYGTPVVMPKDIQDGKICINNIARVSSEHVNRLVRHKLKTGDIVYSRRGDVGRCAYVSKQEKDWLCGTGCLRVTLDAARADSKFVFYQLQTDSSIQWVEKHAVGSTMLNLNTAILGDVPVYLPSLAEQRRIADILSAYDDLIENNRKQIKLLEEAAQRLYREWFIDLHFPGYEHTKIINGIPEGWKKIFLGDAILIYYGKDHKNVPDGPIPVYGSGGLMRKCSRSLFSGESVLIPRKGTLNNIMYRDEEFWVVDTMFYTKMKVKDIGCYVYSFLRTHDMNAMNIGAAIPSMTTSILNSLGLLLPAPAILTEFQKITKRMFSEIALLHRKNESTMKMRDSLLPKLMNGDLF